METVIETNCVIEHEGHRFESGGSVIYDNYIIAYMSTDMNTITNWHGEFIARARVTKSWTIRSYMSNKMHQVYITVNGVHYTGRTLGAGMIVKLKKCAK